MKSIKPVQLGSLFLLLTFILGVSGCAAPGNPGSAQEPSISVYPGHHQEPKALTPLEQGGINLSLPPGWKAAPAIKGTDLKLQKEGKVLSFVLKCFTPLMAKGKDGVRNALRYSVNSTLHNSRLATGPFALDNSGNAPIFESYSGTFSDGGQDAGMMFFIAYNLNVENNSACRYGALLGLSQKGAAEIEPEFVAIIRSLR